jgi:hypothetical protein
MFSVFVVFFFGKKENHRPKKKRRSGEEEIPQFATTTSTQTPGFDFQVKNISPLIAIIASKRFGRNEMRQKQKKRKKLETKHFR